MSAALTLSLDPRDPFARAALAVSPTRACRALAMSPDLCVRRARAAVPSRER